MSIVKKTNKFTGEIELEIQGILKSYSNALMLTNNSLNRPYRLAKVEITYPDNSKSIVDSLLFESIRKNNPVHLETDSEVTLKVYTEGARRGYSQILPPKISLVSFNKLPTVIQKNLLWVALNNKIFSSGA